MFKKTSYTTYIIYEFLNFAIFCIHIRFCKCITTTLKPTKYETNFSGTNYTKSNSVLIASILLWQSSSILPFWILWIHFSYTDTYKIWNKLNLHRHIAKHIRIYVAAGHSTFLPPANEVCEGYVFTPVCQSFCSQLGGSNPACIAGLQAHTQGGAEGLGLGGPPGPHLEGVGIPACTEENTSLR